MAQGGARTRQKGATVHSCQQERDERKEGEQGQRGRQDG